METVPGKVSAAVVAVVLVSIVWPSIAEETSAESVFADSTFAGGQSGPSSADDTSLILSSADVDSSLAKVLAAGGPDNPADSVERLVAARGSRPDAARLPSPPDSGTQEHSGWIMALAAFGAFAFVTYRRFRVK